MPEQTLSDFRTAIERPYGMLLLTGPTGSGKTTTLYAALREINRPERNIMTVEDPIEYAIEGTTQVQVSTKVSFAGALRSLLRHDPDILMLGEIRDHETADIALKAAITGHLVFSTLHTNNAVSAVTRLVDIGAERFLLGPTLIGVIAQRLVRRLCLQCRVVQPTSAEEASWLELEDGQSEIYEPKGCPACVGTGYRGRTGLYESLWFNSERAQMVVDGASEMALSAAAADQATLWKDGCEKVRSGITTLAELRRVVVRPEGEGR